MYVDTHCHIYSEEFDTDRAAVIEAARGVGVEKLLLPNVDMDTVSRLHDTVETYKDYCYPMMGLHPTSVTKEYKAALSSIEKELGASSYIAIGEIGLDLYWDKTYVREQMDAFSVQLEWARQLGLPLSIHVREAFSEIRSYLDSIDLSPLTGVFHCFSGTEEDVQWLINSTPFYVGITGNVTYKKSTLPQVISSVPLDRLVIETDSPYLAPGKFRSKRNEPAYLPLIAEFLSGLFDVSVEKMKYILLENTQRLYKRAWE